MNLKKVESIKNIERSLGDGKKVPAESEKLGIKMVRRSLTANKINLETIIKESDIALKDQLMELHQNILKKLLV